MRTEWITDNLATVREDAVKLSFLRTYAEFVQQWDAGEDIYIYEIEDNVDS